MVNEQRNEVIKFAHMIRVTKKWEFMSDIILHWHGVKSRFQRLWKWLKIWWSCPILILWWGMTSRAPTNRWKYIGKEIYTLRIKLRRRYWIQKKSHDNYWRIQDNLDYRLLKEIPWRFVGRKVDPDAGDETWSVGTEGICETCCDSSSPPDASGVDGLAILIATGSLSPPESETGPGGSLGWVENTKKCGRPWADDRILWPSLLPIWWALPIAAAAAKCWMIRSSSSAPLAPTGNCITIQTQE